MYTIHTISWEEHLAWYGQLQTSSTKETFIFYEKDQPLGVVNFNQIDFIASRCYWGFYIGVQTAPKGSGTILGILALDYMFKEVGIHKVCAEVIETNIRSYHYHRKLGFETEGRLLEHIWKDDRYMDVFTMGLFSEKWSHVREDLIKQRGKIG